MREDKEEKGRSQDTEGQETIEEQYIVFLHGISHISYICFDSQ